ncbi:hypothetical protein ARMGADRAFT_749527 [Armillaria gallica]|uniref:Uncharacterized protein n=1 Tax=Armillaria gallica TaxID=47427 RepID=A0A2H3DWJ0_ARMGA|nr:hypothetical protein ARMGADRAFT_749527 [Armillaria gallica]
MPQTIAIVDVCCSKYSAESLASVEQPLNVPARLPVNPTWLYAPDSMLDRPRLHRNLQHSHLTAWSGILNDHDYLSFHKLERAISQTRSPFCPSIDRQPGLTSQVSNSTDSTLRKIRIALVRLPAVSNCLTAHTLCHGGRRDHYEDQTYLRSAHVVVGFRSDDPQGRHFTVKMAASKVCRIVLQRICKSFYMSSPKA